MTARAPSIGNPSSRNAARTHTTTPVGRGAGMTGVPPTESGLPVTASGIADPRIIDSVSIIHAMTRPSVLTSGAGMSDVGAEER